MLIGGWYQVLYVVDGVGVGVDQYLVFIVFYVFEDGLGGFFWCGVEYFFEIVVCFVYVVGDFFDVGVYVCVVGDIGFDVVWMY